MNFGNFIFGSILKMYQRLLSISDVCMSSPFLLVTISREILRDYMLSEVFEKEWLQVGSL